MCRRGCYSPKVTGLKQYMTCWASEDKLSPSIGTIMSEHFSILPISNRGFDYMHTERRFTLEYPFQRGHTSKMPEEDHARMPISMAPASPTICPFQLRLYAHQKTVHARMPISTVHASSSHLPSLPATTARSSPLERNGTGGSEE
jgi:hypothetical protein